MSVCSEEYLVRTVFLVDHPSKHPRAEQAGLGGEAEVGLGKDSQPCSGIPVGGEWGDPRPPIQTYRKQTTAPACLPLRVETNLDAASAFSPGCFYSSCLLTENRAGSASPLMKEGGEQETGGGEWEREDGRGEPNRTLPLPSACQPVLESGRSQWDEHNQDWSGGRRAGEGHLF